MITAAAEYKRTLGGGTPANYLYDLDGRVNSEIDLAQGSFDNSNHKFGWVASYILPWAALYWPSTQSSHE